MNIADIVADSPDFDLLEQVLAASGLTGLVRDLDEVTVFAPTDAAFAALAADLGYEGDPADEAAVGAYLTQQFVELGGGDAVSALNDVLFYHLHPGLLDAAGVAASPDIETLLQSIPLTPTGGKLVDAEPHLPDAAIVQADIDADNGIVHAIDRVMLPLDVVPPSIGVWVAERGGSLDQDGTDYDLLAALVEQAGLGPTLTAPDADLTLFAPDDAAIRRWAESFGRVFVDDAAVAAFLDDVMTLIARGGDTTPVLTDILTYHVSPGAKTGIAVLSATELVTAQGASIGLDGTELVDQEPDLDDPSLDTVDLRATNGVIHTIDGLLLPQDYFPSDGADAVDVEIGTDAAETFDLGADADWVLAKGGDDRVIGGPGDDVILGGEGIDTAVFEGASGQFGIAIDGDAVEVRDKTGGGLDFLDSVERLEFADGLALNAPGALDVATLSGAAALTEAELSTLVETYIAYFDRAPDALGLLFWADAFADGVSLQEIADLFFAQDETQAKLPDENAALVTAAYRNLLERDPDESGRIFWTNALDSGAVTQGQFMLAVIEGARANPDGQGDVQTVENKADIGIDYALFEGLTDAENAETVMAAYDRADPVASLAAAAALTDGFAADAAPGAADPELTIQIVGLVSDPFAV